MTGLDTNVLVRYLTQDEPRQSAIAARLIDSFSKDEPGFITLIVIVELFWVLQKSYRLPRPEILRIVETLLRSKELVVERSDIVWQAIRRSQANDADFTDCVVASLGHAAQCLSTVTFDKNAAAAAGMKLLE